MSDETVNGQQADGEVENQTGSLVGDEAQPADLHPTVEVEVRKDEGPFLEETFVMAARPPQAADNSKPVLSAKLQEMAAEGKYHFMVTMSHDGRLATLFDRHTKKEIGQYVV